MSHIEPVTETGAGGFASLRHQHILEKLSVDGRLGASELAAQFGVSTETIRRDLIQLERGGYLQRVHGGAVLEHRPLVPDVRQREVLMADEKSAIARAALHLVPSGGLVLLDAGTTTRALAALITPEHAVTIVTPSVTIATDLLERSLNSVHLLGGELSQRTWSTTGDWAERSLASLQATTAFLGASGFSASRGLTTSDHADAALKRAMVASARRVIVLADSSKIGTDHITSAASAETVHCLVTTSRADAGETERIRVAGTDVELA